MSQEENVDAEDEKRRELIHDGGEHDREDERLDREHRLLDDDRVVGQGGRGPRDPLGDRHPREEPGHEEFGKGRETLLDRNTEDDREDRRVENHPEDGVKERPDDPEPGSGVPGADIPNDHLLQKKKLGRQVISLS